MPNKANDDLHGYDTESDTVRVDRRDLWRLLLTFRELTERQEQGSWAHMQDYDISFERMADAVDAGNQALYGREWSGPDYRMRCSLSEAYRWPRETPFSGEMTTVLVTDGLSGVSHGSHYLPASGDQRPRTLCDLGFAPEESEPIAGGPTCPQCRRELDLVRHLHTLRDQAAEPADGR